MKKKELASIPGIEVLRYDAENKRKAMLIRISLAAIWLLWVLGFFSKVPQYAFYYFLLWLGLPLLVATGILIYDLPDKPGKIVIKISPDMAPEDMARIRAEYVVEEVETGLWEAREK